MPRKPQMDLHVLESAHAFLSDRANELRRSIPEEHFRKVEQLLHEYDKLAGESIRLAGTQSVTGLPNDRAKASFITRFSERRSLPSMRDENGCVKPEWEFAALHFDLGGLKAVNDDALLGHEYGNRLLRRTGRMLEIVAGRFGVPREQVFHHGGDEFSVLVTGEGAGVKAQKIADFLVRFRNRLSTRKYPHDPDKALFLPQNTFKIGVAKSNTEPTQNLFNGVFNKAVEAGKLVGATTNHGYLANWHLKRLSGNETNFLNLVTQNVDTRSSDTELPHVAENDDLRRLFSKGELHLSREQLRQALERIGKREYFESILNKISTVKGAEIPHRQ